jgi:hypothetical protein
MKAFVIGLENKPGEMARVSAAVAGKGINITTGAGIAWGGSGAVGLLTEDEGGTRDALREAGLEFRECDALAVPLENRPGTLAEASRRLADAGVNIEFVAPSEFAGGKTTLVVGVEDAEIARKVLGS